MFLTREAIRAAHSVQLPNNEQIFTMTDYDRQLWGKAFEWYNEYMNLPVVDLSRRENFSKVYLALKKAKEFFPREEKI